MVKSNIDLTQSQMFQSEKRDRINFKRTAVNYIEEKMMVRYNKRINNSLNRNPILMKVNRTKLLKQYKKTQDNIVNKCKSLKFKDIISKSSCERCGKPFIIKRYGLCHKCNSILELSNFKSIYGLNYENIADNIIIKSIRKKEKNKGELLWKMLLE